MTLYAHNWAMRQNQLPTTTKFVLCVIADCINAEHEFAFPGRSWIAERVGKTERQVRNCINALEAAGLIRCVLGPGKGRGKGRQSARYYLACDHRTGAPTPLTTGNQLPLVKAVTRGNGLPLVTVTRGNFGPLQGEKTDTPYIEEPAIEPEQKKEPETASQKKQVKKGRKEAPPYTPPFTGYWQIWPLPRRALSNKRKAFERWQEAEARYGAEAIMTAAKLYLAKPEVRKENFKYCRLAEVFLNGGLESAIEAASEPRQKVWSKDANDWVEA